MKYASLLRSSAARAALLLASFLGVSSAHAQNDAALAEALFNQGRTAFDAGNYDEACAKFGESYRIESTLGTQLNLAACEAKRSHVATAWGLFRAVEQKLQADDPRRAYVQKNLKELEPRVPHVVLRLKKGSPSQTTIRVGVVQVGAAGFGQELPVDPGNHRWVVSAPGHENRLVELTIQEGETVDVDVEAGAAEVAAPLRDPASESVANPAEDQAPSSPSSSFRVGAFAGVGVGVLGVVGTGLFGALTLSQKKKGDEACPSATNCTSAGAEALDRARTYRLLTNVSLGAAVLGAGLSTYFFIRLASQKDRETNARSDEATRGPKRRVSQWSTVQVGVSPTNTGAEVQLTGSFF